MAGAALTVSVLGNVKDLQDKLGNATDSTKRFGDDTERHTGRAGKAAALGLAAVGAAGAVVGKWALDTGAQLEQMDAKAKTVFGDQIPLVKKWADQTAAAMGLTKTQATSLAANFGDLLIPMGFTRDEAAKMSTKVIGLSGALSEWSGGTKKAAEVSDILAKAMLGERDGLKALGISISAADVAGRLATKGQQELTGAALEQAEALAVQELIFEKSTDAQDAFAKGTAKGIRAQAEFSAKIGEAKEAIARGLYPIIIKVAGFLVDTLSPVFKEIAGGVRAFAAAWRDANGDVTSSGFPGFMEKLANFIHATVIPAFHRLKDIFQSVFGWLKDNAKPVLVALGAVVATVVIPPMVAWAAATVVALAPVIALTAAVAAFAGGLVWAYEHCETFRKVIDAVARFLTKTIWPAIQAFVGYIVDAFSGLVDWTRDHWDAIQEAVGHVVNVIKGIAGGFAAFWRAWGDDIWNIVKTAFNAIKETIENVIQVIRGIIQTVMALINGDWGRAWDGIKNIFGGIWDQIGNIISTAIGFIKGLLGGLVSSVGELLGGIVGHIAGLPGRIASAAAGMWNGIIDSFKGAINWIIDRWNDFRITLGGQRVDLPFGMGFTVPTITLDTPNIPRLAEGGIVTRPTLVMAGESGPEAVIPLRGGRAGVVENRYYTIVTYSLDPVTAGPVVMKAIRDYETKNGTDWRASG